MMVEEGMPGGGGGDKLPLQSSFAATACQTVSSYYPYPPPLATYKDVVDAGDLFMDTLKKLHASMGTKFMIPVVGGRDLDLHRLFVEVTSRGGIVKVVQDRKWKEVTAVFSFPSSATNASFILRKYYVSLLYHYEQIYFFRARCSTPSPTDAMQHLSKISARSRALPEYVSSVPLPTFTASPKLRANKATSMHEAPSAGSPVCGVIDGKFDSGYLITVKIGSEELKGVLYQVPYSEAQTITYHHVELQARGESAAFVHNSSVKPGMPRRKRRKKSEIRRRDPAHPKPNRSGYNFFFSEQHAKLKPFYHGKDREISRIIGESWNKLQQPERAVYQEKALRDKERYRAEMEDYRERLRTGQVFSSAVPTQQLPPALETNPANPSSSHHFEGTASAYTEENAVSSDESDKSNLEEYDSADKGSEFGECSQVDMELKNVNVEILAEEGFDLQTIHESVGQDDKNQGDGSKSTEQNIAFNEDGVAVPTNKGEKLPGQANESVPGL